MSRTPEYFAWCQARARCRDINHQAYADYGGRGIYVCREWDESFEAFYRDMGPRPSPKHTLDRIDNNGPYAPGNCRWVTFVTQHNNRRRNMRLRFRDEEHTVAEWSRIVGIRRGAIYQRLANGWPVERALTVPEVEKAQPQRRFATWNGVTLPVVEWAQRVGISDSILRTRLRHGWPAERALTTPVRK